MKIYTKTGDKGSTALYGGTRVSKADIRVEAYGTVDELNSFIGLAMSEMQVEEVKASFSKVQFDLFTLGSEVATPKDKLLLANGKSRLPLVIEKEDIEFLENEIDRMELSLEPLAYFILPHGSRVVSALHVARTVCRRAERTVVYLAQHEELRDELLQYLNRLSDYLFTAARYFAKINEEAESYWNPNQR